MGARPEKAAQKHTDTLPAADYKSMASYESLLHIFSLLIFLFLEQVQDLIYFRSVASIDDDNVSSPEKLAWQQVIGDLTSQPGCLGLQWTQRVESPSWHVVRIDWNTAEAYASPQSHKRFEELISPLSTDKGVISDREKYEPITASKVVSAAPTIEIPTLLIPSSTPSDEETLALEEAAIKVSNSTLPRLNGVKAVAQVWLTGELDRPDSLSGKAKELRFVMAWPSLELPRVVVAEEKFKTNMNPIKKKCSISSVWKGNISGRIYQGE